MDVHGAWDIQSHCCRSYYFLDCECREAGWDPICARRAQKWRKCFALEDHYYLFLSLSISIKKYFKVFLKSKSAIPTVSSFCSTLTSHVDSVA